MGYILSGVFVGVNVIVGVICDHFSRMQDKHAGSLFLTDQQRVSSILDQRVDKIFYFGVLPGLGRSTAIDEGCSVGLFWSADTLLSIY